jgi:hypothetical protein
MTLTRHPTPHTPVNPPLTLPDHPIFTLHGLKRPGMSQSRFNEGRPQP